MGANSNRVLHVDASNFPVYDTKDLDLFQSILNNIVEEYESVGSLVKERQGISEDTAGGRDFQECRVR